MGIVEQHPTNVKHFQQDRAEPVAIRLLGGFSVAAADRVVHKSAWRLKKARSVVKLLALAHGRQLTRDALMEYLWPDLDPRAAANNFHRAVHFARRALSEAGGGDTAFLHLHDQVLSLAPPGAVWVDVDAFEAAATVALRSNDPAQYQAAIELYDGDLLPEDQYEDWAADRRVGLRDTYMTLLLNLARIDEQHGEISAAQSLLQQVLEHEPVHEDAHAGLIRLYARAGQRHQALRQYDHLTEALQRDLDAQPSAASQRLYRDIVEERFPAQPVTPLAGTPRPEGDAQTNLPSHLTSFIGRQQERSAVTELIAAHRLVTITGPGGSGKTRLALEVASDLAGSFPNGVWLVELASLNDPGLITRTVLTTLGAQETPGQAMVTTLQRFLRNRRLLLIMDSCEHLIEASADLAHRLLHACPHLRILATSRETLRVAGEATWLIPPLATPDPERLPPFRELLEVDAVRLFLDRAQERYPALVVNAERAASIAQICHRLEGIPLAIELAAGRTRTLSLEQMAARLDDSLHLLSYGPRTGPRRQQPLEATIDWSYRLLADAEQRVFRQLSIFPNGCTLTAAEAVCSSDNSPAAATLDILDQLVDKSLITLGTQSDTLRYRLLEPIRQFAGERLQQCGETEATRRRHVAWCLAFAIEADSKIWTDEQTAGVKRLEAERDNMRAALAWYIEHDVETGLELAGNLWWFWRMRGDFWEGRHWLESILARISQWTAVEAKALLAVGTLAAIQGDFEAARPRIEQSLRIFRAVGDTRFIGWATANLGYLDLHNHRLESAETLLQEGLALLQTAGDYRGVGWALAALADVAAGRNDLALAAGFFEQRLNVHRTMGDERGISWALLGMANIARIKGDPDRAKPLLEESLELSYEVGDKWATAWTLTCLGMLALTEDNGRQARTLLHESLAIFKTVGDRHGCVYSLFCFGLLLLQEGDYTGVIHAIRQAESHPPPLAAWLTPRQRAECEAAVRAACDALEPARCAEIEREARSMTLDQTIASVCSHVPLR
ncbi:BTAD domain-containing putative transcriptional regulator [soil metagenome]